MGKFQDKLARFMSGRYGMDQLNNALIFLCVALMILYNFIKSPIIGGVMWVFFVWSVYRMYSRDVEKRTRENDKFMKLWKPIRRRFSLSIRKIKGIKTYRYRKCPQCKAVIELPFRKGDRMIRCPRCHTDFETHISF